MMIRVGIIDRGHFEKAIALASTLERAVNEGDITRTDALTKELADLLATNTQTTISDEAWRGLNTRVRAEMPDYAAGYLLSPAICAVLNKYVCGHGLDAMAALLHQAATSGDSLLQVPVEADT